MYWILQIHEAATLLDESNLVTYDANSGCFQVTDFGRIASYHNVAHRTISMYYNSLKPTMGYEELCQLFSLSEELKHVTVKEDEKLQLEELFNHVHIPIKESLEETTAKVNVLLQAYISQTKLEGLSMTSDMVFITQVCFLPLRSYWKWYYISFFTLILYYLWEIIGSGIIFFYDSVS